MGHEHLGSKVIIVSSIEKIFDLITPPSPPKQKATILKGLGDNRIDYYYWLRELDNPETKEYLDAESEYAKQVTSFFESLRSKIFNEFLDRIELADSSVPQQHKKYWYYSKTNSDSQYEIHLRFLNDGEHEVILDENDLASNKDYFAVGSSAISLDENMLAYGVDLDGSELFKLYLKDLTTSQTVPLPIENATYGLEFDMSGTKLFWVEADDAMRPYRVNMFDLNRPLDGSTVIFTEPDEAFAVGISKSKDDKTLVIDSSSTTSSEVHMLDLVKNDGLKIFLPRQPLLEYSVEPVGDFVYVLSNHNAENFKLSTGSRTATDIGELTDLQAHDPDVKLESFEVFENHVALEERRAGFSRVVILELRDGSRHYVPADEEGSTLEIDSNPNLDSKVLRYSYTSMKTPRSIREIDLHNKSISVLKDSKVHGGFDKNNYSSEVIRVTSRDNQSIPVSLFYKSGTKLDGSNPLLLYGYGSYEHSIDPAFSAMRLSLCDRGIIFAIAHVRGGGELGRSWYLDGKLNRKHNTFNDFVDVARGLITLGYTSKKKIVSWGGSAGGMLVTAALNQDPDLFGGVVAEVPFVDCLTTISDPSLPLTIPEWQEWGNPLDDWEIYQEMLSYSPYDNIQADTEYPPIFVTAGLNDPRVAYFEPTKFVAKMRMISKTPKVLLWVETGAGHFGASGRFNEWETVSRVYSFIVACLLGIDLDANSQGDESS